MLKHAYVTEKATAQLDRENKLTFIADVEDTKDDIKKAVEEIYDVTVVDVKTLVTPKGFKKATITLSSDDSAEEVAARLGIF
jgi:large subunit ribosomal protein L23